MSWLKAALGIAATAVVHNAVVQPRQIGAVARAYCDRVGKPLLLISEPSAVRKLLGAPVRAEVTTSQVGRTRAPDKAFGAVLAIGVLERQARPDLALQEWRRIADTVYVIVPPWWSPMTWLNPNNQWYIEPSLKRAAPIWSDRRRVYLLQVSDKGYGSPAWTPTRKSPSTTIPRSLDPSPPNPPDTNSLPVPDLRSGGTAMSDPPSSATHLVTIEGELPDYDDLGSAPFSS